MSIGERIKELRERRGQSQSQFAAAIDVSPSAVAYWEIGRNDPSKRVMERIATRCQVSKQWLIGEERGDRPRSEVDFSRARPIPDMPRDLPVYGAARGGFDGDEIRLDAPMGYALRPPHLAGTASAVAVIVVGDSMEPRYFAGEIVYVDQRLPARPRDFVLVELTEHRALVKRLVRISDQFVEVEQLNPAQRRKLPRAEVTGVFRIVGSAPGDSF